MRNSFILYSSYEEVLKELPKEEIGELLMAIFAYQRTGENQGMKAFYDSFAL